MKNYIILRNNVHEHFFVNKTDEIVFHIKDNSTAFTPVQSNAIGDFGLFFDERKNIHIVNSDRKNNVIYTLIKNNNISHHILLSAKLNLALSDFSIKMHNGILNLFYIAETGGELFLIHCVLGNNALPAVISKINDKNYFLHEGRIYFSDSDTTLGYCDFSDGKPDKFMPLFKNSHSPYLCGSESRKHITWKCGNDIILDGSPIITDKNAQLPIIIDGDNPMLMWKSGELINYINISEPNSAPMRFVSTGKSPQLFCVQNHDYFTYFYGTFTDGKVSIFGKSDIFPQSENNTSPDLMQIMRMLNNVQKEINDIKAQIRNTTEKI